MNSVKLPQPLISDQYAITITSKDLDKSVQFYEKLGFREVFRSDFPFPFVQVSDDALLIMLRKDAKPYLALTYYAKDPDKIAGVLEKAGVEFQQKPGKNDMIKRYIIQSPDNFIVSIVTGTDMFKKPKGPTMLNMKQTDYFKPEKYPNPVIGMPGEISHPVKDLQKAIAWWKRLGFEALSQYTSPYHWAILSDGLVTIGLHQTKQFSYPAITYFASDMKEKIEALKKNGVKKINTLTDTDIVLETPEGQHINLFRLGM